MMTKKEQLRMDELIVLNIRLQDEINKHMRIYGETLSELVQYKTRVETLRDVANWGIGAEYEP